MARRRLMPQHLSWPSRCEHAIRYHGLAIHQHPRNPLGIVVRIGEGAHVSDPRGVKQGEVGDAPLSRAPAVAQTEPCSGQACHLVYGLFEREYVLVAHVVS